MVTIESTVDRRDGVTLVTATVAGGTDAVAVTLASRLDGPIWPPRRQGEPEACWTPEGFEGVVPADGALAIGFASPAEPVEPPLELVETEPVDSPAAPNQSGDDASETADALDTPSAIVRGLGDPSPPSLIDAGDEGASDAADATSNPAAGERPAALSENGAGGAAADGAEVATVTAVTGEDGDESLPPAVADWLRAVEDRLDVADGLRADASVAAATGALQDCDGADGARDLAASVERDADRLHTLARRAERLAERAEGTTVATDVLDRLP